MSSYIERSMNFWINKETSPNATTKNGQTDNLLPGAEGQSTPILGKRIQKRKFSIEDVELSSNDEKFSEGSISDWEDGNIRKNKRATRAKSVPRFFDKRLMKFERKNLEDGIRNQNFRLLDSNISPITENRDSTINLDRYSELSYMRSHMMNRGVRISKAPVLEMKQSIVNAALANASKLISPKPNSESNVLIIDMNNVSNNQQNNWRNDQESISTQMSCTIDNNYPPPLNNWGMMNNNQRYGTPNQSTNQLPPFMTLKGQSSQHAPQISIPSGSDSLNMMSTDSPHLTLNSSNFSLDGSLLSIDNSNLAVEQICVSSPMSNSLHTDITDYDIKSYGSPNLDEPKLDPLANSPPQQQIIYLPQSPPNPSLPSPNQAFQFDSDPLSTNSNFDMLM